MPKSLSELLTSHLEHRKSIHHSLTTNKTASKVRRWPHDWQYNSIINGLKCHKMQGNAALHLRFMAQGVPHFKSLQCHGHATTGRGHQTLTYISLPLNTLHLSTESNNRKHGSKQKLHNKTNTNSKTSTDIREMYTIRTRKMSNTEQITVNVTRNDI